MVSIRFSHKYILFIRYKLSIMLNTCFQNVFLKKKHNLKMKSLFFLLCNILSFALVVVVSMSTTNTTVGKASVINKEVKMLIPEGWGFFTRDPQEDINEIYKIEGKSLHNAIYESTNYRYFFGLSRKYRRLEAEREIIMSKVPLNKWKSSTPILPINNCRDTVVNVQSKSIRNLHGLYLVRKSKRIPWSWRHLKYNRKNLIKYAIVFVN